LVDPVRPAANTTSQQTYNKTSERIPISPDKSKQANASTHTKSYQGTWVELWRHVEEVIEDDAGYECEDDHVGVCHKEFS